MDLEKAYDRADRETRLSVLTVCGMGGRLLEGIKALLKVNGELSDNFDTGVGV